MGSPGVLLNIPMPKADLACGILWDGSQAALFIKAPWQFQCAAEAKNQQTVLTNERVLETSGIHMGKS